MSGYIVLKIEDKDSIQTIRSILNSKTFNNDDLHIEKYKIASSGKCLVKTKSYVYVDEQFRLFLFLMSFRILKLYRIENETILVIVFDYSKDSLTLIENIMSRLLEENINIKEIIFSENIIPSKLIEEIINIKFSCNKTKIIVATKCALRALILPFNAIIEIEKISHLSNTLELLSYIISHNYEEGHSSLVKDLLEVSKIIRSEHFTNSIMKISTYIATIAIAIPVIYNILVIIFKLIRNT